MLYRWCGIDDVCTSAVKGYRVEGSCDSEVRNNGRVIVVPAVALRRDIHDEIDVEIRLVKNDGLGIFCNLVVEFLCRAAASNYGTIMLADSYALTAANAF